MILINGYFLCRKITGIERYALEITNRLDNISSHNEIAIIIPGNCAAIPVYKNLKIIKYKKKIPHILWQLLYLQCFLLFHPQYTILDFGNTCLPLFPGVIFLHDIYCEFFPEDFTTFRDKVVRIYNRWQYRLISKRAKKIVTVSHFTKNQIILEYKANPDKITVIYSSWNHFLTIKSDYSVFDDFPLLQKQFYFSLGSLSKRKNIKWIIEYAIKKPNNLFAISGTIITTANAFNYSSLPDNIIFLGYLGDSKIKALMEKCAAFILPSYYEGFGLTPLEALSCGAQIIISNSASLPEIYGKTAHYIDPFNTDINIDQLLLEPVDSPEELLKKYSYDNSTEKVYKIIKEMTK